MSATHIADQSPQSPARGWTENPGEFEYRPMPVLIPVCSAFAFFSLTAFMIDWLLAVPAVGILLASVEEFSLQNLSIKDSHCWAISLERCAHGTVRDLHFASSGVKRIDGVAQTILNQDGLDLRMGCHDLVIENITGYSGDDLIALTAIPNPDGVAGSVRSTMVSSTRDR